MSEEAAKGGTALAAEAHVDWGYVRGCEGAKYDSRIRFRLGGFFFNSGGTSYCGDRTGDVWAQIWIRDRHNDKLGKDVYDVSANVWRCDDAKCKTGKSMFFKRLGLISEDEVTKLGVRWADQDNSFVFASSQGDVTYKYEGELINHGDVGGHTYSKGIQTTTDIQNCAVSEDIRPYGVISAKVNNFYVNQDYKDLGDAHPGRACQPLVCESCVVDAGDGEGACNHEDEASVGFKFFEGFESVSVDAGKWITYPASNGFADWQVTKGSVDIHSNTTAGGVGSGAGGQNHVDLAGDSLGSVERKIDGLVPGARYKLSYKYARHTCTKEAAAYVSIGDLEYKWAANNNGRDNWLDSSHEFVAGNEVELIKFTGLGSDTSCGMLIDDIAIVSALSADGSSSSATDVAVKPKVTPVKKAKKVKKKAKKSKKAKKAKKGHKAKKGKKTRKGRKNQKAKKGAVKSKRVKRTRKS